MGRLDTDLLRYMAPEDMRTLIAVELGMRNHEVVPRSLVASIAGLRAGGVYKILHKLGKHRLVCSETGKRYQGYRLTNLGYDFLALRTLCARNVLTALGRQIGVGKESDIYIALTPTAAKYEHHEETDDMQDIDRISLPSDSECESKECVVKFHRLGRTSFRRVRETRDYHGHRQKCNWLYLSRLAALREFTFMKALHSHGFPVPQPLECCRHALVMELCPGYPLSQIRELEHPENVFSDLMDIMVKMASHGLVHCDFNEFNIMIDDDDKPTIIDFPQMVSLSHPNAEVLFNRDVASLRAYFKRRYNFESESYPTFSSITREASLDEDVKASGVDNSESVDLSMFGAHSQLNEEYQNEDVCELDEEQLRNVAENFNHVMNLKTKQQNSELSSHSASSIESLEPKEGQDLSNVQKYKKCLESLSALSTGTSTIPPSVARSRLSAQSKKKAAQASRRRTVRQGEASLITQKRRENRDTIKTSVSVEWY